MKKIIITAVILVAINFAANAQPGSTTGGFDDEPQDVPLDGGISLLAIAGAAYGYKKMNILKKTKYEI
jgi:hypothetical protein